MLMQLRKITSLALAMVFIVLLCTPMSVGAVIPGEDSFLGSQDAIYSIRGKDISVVLSRKLANYNIEVEDNTLLEVVPSGIEEGTTALMVTNTDEGFLTKALVFAINGEGSIQSISKESIDPASTRETQGGEEDPFYNESFLAVWAVQFNREIIYSRVCTQPLYAQFIYFNEGGHAVQSFSMQYVTEGLEYSYPGKVDLDSETIHTMTIASTSPKANKYYVNTDAFREDRMICVEFLGQHYVDFTFRINGRDYMGRHYLTAY